MTEERQRHLSLSNIAISIPVIAITTQTNSVVSCFMHSSLPKDLTYQNLVAEDPPSEFIVEVFQTD